MTATRPFSPFEWMLALRYLRAKRAESFISVISVISLVGIALGVATLIIVMSVMNGFRHELLSKILGLQGHIMVQGIDGGLANYDSVATRVRTVPGVIRVAPIIDGQVIASSNGITSGVLVRGLRKSDLKSFTTVSQTLSPDALDNYESGESVIIGFRLAQKLRIAPGMSITLIAPRGDVTPFGTTPRIKTYKVAGTFDIGMIQYDSSFVFMPLDEAQLFFNMGDTVSGLETMVADPDKVDDLILPIQRTAGPFARPYSWHDTQSTFFDAIQVERNVMFLILTLIILVAALNIVSGLYMLVKDKSADIAILRTMGATRGAIMRIFMIAGVSIGIVGTFLGFVLGVAFCANIETIRVFLSQLTGTTLFNPEIYFLSHMPAEMNPSEVASVVIMSLTLSFLATLYPAWRAARLDPVEALRYE
ncbi:MAG: lipoprotein-releasing ABC transporter permease subunit [Rhizomicrobium sp.]